MRLKGGNSVTWVMDLNPDEAIAAHWLREGSIVAKMLRKAQIYGFRGAQKVIVLDRFMQERIISKGIPRDKIRVISPWSHDDQIRYDVAGRAEFRAQHQLSDKFVVMYSGNHSPCHPLDTILEAAKRLASTRKWFSVLSAAAANLSGCNSEPIKRISRTSAAFLTGPWRCSLPRYRPLICT